MRVMVIGSIPGHIPGAKQPLQPEHEYLFSVAREIGYALAEAGIRILVASFSPRTVDAYVLNGVADYCRDNPTSKSHVEVHRPDDEQYTLPDEPNNRHFTLYPHHADKSSPHKWVVAHARAADSADVVVAIAGGTSTRLVGHLAADRGKPTIAVPCFGGAAETLFGVLRYRYSGSGIKQDALPLLQTWREGSACSLVRLAMVLHQEQKSMPTHSYFLSNTWDDCAAADHVETLLRREHRVVLRDETSLQSGGALSSGVQALIEECSTFVALWSKDYATSSWCPHELE